MHRYFVRTAVAAGLTLAALTAFGAAKPADKGKAKTDKPATPSLGNADAITQDELKVYLYFLASDQMEGRNFPSRGYDTAALYVASHLAEWGLKPGGSKTGTVGPLQPYFMPIEMVAKSIIPEDTKLSITAPGGGAGGRGGFGGPGGGGQGGGGQGGGPNAAAANEPRTTAFEYSKDWTNGTPGGFGGGRGGAQVQPLDIDANLVFAGNGYVINKSNTNPYDGLDVKGKIIVVAGLPAELAAAQGGAAGGGRGQGGGGRRQGAAATDTPAAAAGTPAAAAQPAPPARGANPLGEPCVDFYSPEQFAAKNGALAVITIANFQQIQAMTNPNAGPFGRNTLNGPAFQVEKFLSAPQACPAAPSITAGPSLTTALFQGEKQSGQQVFYAAGNNAKLDSFAFSEKKKLALKIGVKTEKTHGENVIGILEGSDPVLKNEFVVMSAHLDHLGLSTAGPDGKTVNNGADDDGSGSTGLLGIAHAYATGAAKGIRPKRSMLFLWVGGEEKGLWGSQYFAEFPPIDLSKVVADLNIDMIGRTKNPNSVDTNPTHTIVEPGEIFVVGPNISSDDLGNTLDTVNAGFQKLKINHFYDATAPDATHDNLGPQPNGQRIFYRSDHYNFAKMGVPIAFFTIGLHVDYHQKSDTPDKIDYTELQKVAKTVAAVSWELGNSETRPKLKANLPEQLQKDMKAVQTQGWGKQTPVLPPLPGMPY